MRIQKPLLSAFPQKKRKRKREREREKSSLRKRGEAASHTGLTLLSQKTTRKNSSLEKTTQKDWEEEGEGGKAFILTRSSHLLNMHHRARDGERGFLFSDTAKTTMTDTHTHRERGKRTYSSSHLLSS